MLPARRVEERQTMQPQTLSGMIQATQEFRVLSDIGVLLRDLDGITHRGSHLADYLCALVPDEVVERYGVKVPVSGPAGPHCHQLKLNRGYEVHLFPTGNKHLMSNDGSGRYLNADRSPECGWCGPSPASTLLFSIDVATGLVEEMDGFVQNYLALKR